MKTTSTIKEIKYAGIRRDNKVVDELAELKALLKSAKYGVILIPLNKNLMPDHQKQHAKGITDNTKQRLATISNKKLIASLNKHLSQDYKD